MQTQESNETVGVAEVDQLLTRTRAISDATLVAMFYDQLIKSGLAADVAKDLTIAYIVRPTIFGQ